MHREPLLQMLQAYGRRFPEEQACVARFIAFVRAHDDCFKRSLRLGHVTGSAWVVNAGGNQVLLNHHRKLGKWLQFGGHADGQADVLAVALREAVEESGLRDIEPAGREIFDLDIHPIPARGNEPAHEHFDVRFAMRALGSQSFTVSDESHELAWVPIERLEAYTTEPSMLRMRDKWRRLRQPAGRGSAD